MGSGRITIGAGVSLGTALAVPAAAQAEDFQVNNLNDSGNGSLREAIEDAEANPGADRVLFKSKLSGQIDLSSGSLYISEPVQILGPGARRLTVNQGAETQVLFIFASGDDVSVSGLTLTGGNAIPLAGSGGAIQSNADLTLSRVVLQGNTADADGGAIASFGGSLTIEDSTISGNRAVGGSGQYGGGIYASDGDVVVTNSTISGNTAGEDGGGDLLAEQL